MSVPNVHIDSLWTASSATLARQSASQLFSLLASQLVSQRVSCLIKNVPKCASSSKRNYSTPPHPSQTLPALHCALAKLAWLCVCLKCRQKTRTETEVDRQKHWNGHMAWLAKGRGNGDGARGADSLLRQLGKKRQRNQVAFCHLLHLHKKSSGLLPKIPNSPKWDTTKE